MSSPFTVAWIDEVTRAGTCPIHTMPTEARDPELCGLIAVDEDGAAGKACTEDGCGQPLVGNPHEGSRILLEERVDRSGRPLPPSDLVPDILPAVDEWPSAKERS